MRARPAAMGSAVVSTSSSSASRPPTARRVRWSAVSARSPDITDAVAMVSPLAWSTTARVGAGTSTSMRTSPE